MTDSWHSAAQHLAFVLADHGIERTPIQLIRYAISQFWTFNVEVDSERLAYFLHSCAENATCLAVVLNQLERALFPTSMDEGVLALYMHPVKAKR